MDILPIGEGTFTAENIRNCEEYVLSMQRRLDKAVADNDKEGIRNLIDLIAKRSNAVRVLATWRITQRNTSKYTAGVDGIAIPQGQSREHQNLIRHNIMKEIDIDKKPDKIRRVYIPKSNGKKRPLGIPTLHDRIVQEVIRIAIDPISEYHFNGHSYGFRPKRSCQDAMSQLFLKLADENRFKYVLEGDIKGCFGNIKHEHIIETLIQWHVPKWITENINKMLKSKIFYNGEVYDSDTGTPQGGVISPLLCNVALTTLDDLCGKFGGQNSNPIVRYADDFVIVCKAEPYAKEVKEEIAEHLQTKVGLTLSEEKTEITHIYKGFNFLGFNFKKYKTLTKGGKVKYTLSIRPQKEKVQNLLENCKEILDNHKTATQSDIIRLLSPKLIGWAMYYRHVVARRTFSRVDGKLWEKLYNWAKRRHPNKPKKWIIQRYFQRTPERKSHFVDRETNNRLPTIGRIPMKRFIKVNNRFRVYDIDPDVIAYWTKREYLNAFEKIENVKRKKLFHKQKGNCPHCKGIISEYDIEKQDIHVHHVIPQSEGGTDSYSNLRLLHAECHREIHGKKDDVIN